MGQVESLHPPLSEDERLAVLGEPTVDALVAKIVAGKYQNVVVMAGAGISVAAGIPDFRTPGTGLYDNLQKYDLPHPTAIFELDYFKENPAPFFTLARELYPGGFKPTRAHYFLSLLHRKGLLRRVYTQNIDCLERIAGLPDDLLVEAHGSFATARCLSDTCGRQYSAHDIADTVFKGEIVRCECGGLIKPNIVFFGERLPDRFFKLMAEDFPICDLLIIMGTSLKVHPFASLIDKVGGLVPRLLLNRELVGTRDESTRERERESQFHIGALGGLCCDEPGNYRDVALLGDMEDSVAKLCTQLAWSDELEALVRAGPVLDSFLPVKPVAAAADAASAPAAADAVSAPGAAADATAVPVAGAASATPATTESTAGARVDDGATDSVS